MPLSTGKYSQNETAIYQYLMSNGYSLAQTCGILSNIEKESSFNPANQNAGEGAYGLCQWRLSRRTDLFSRFGSSPSLKSQLQFIGIEFETTEKNARKYFFGGDVVNSREGAALAAEYFAKKYERCAAVNVPPRLPRAREFWDYYYQKPQDTTMQPSNDLKFPEPTVIVPSQPTVTVVSKAPSYIELETIDDYSKAIKKNLSKVKAAGFDYGYLINLSYGGEFKFYIPEFSEIAGANWNNIDIPGRSVNIFSYNSTNSRNITVSLELFAGAGLYSTGDDVVAKMHSDANFVKSLEYPDYDEGIVDPPATVQLILGSAISMQGVVRDVNVEHKKPLDVENRAMHLRLTFTVSQVVSEPLGQSDIRKKVTSIISTSKPSTLSNR